MMIQALLFVFLAQQPLVTTAQYDNARTGANLKETQLTPANVSGGHFGKQFILPVDGDVTAEPLFVPKLTIPGKGVHDVVFIATGHDSIYAFDAAGKPADPLWHLSLIDPAKGVDTVRAQAAQCSFLSPEIGIASTPVIDAAAGTMYLIARTAERGADGKPRYFQRLHSIDILTGSERPGSPVLIRASISGSSYFGLAKREVTFHALLENQRAALLLDRGTIYAAWSSSCDVGPYYGWVLAYDARSLKQTGVFNASPDATESGIWQSGAGMAADSSGAVYTVTGNGKFTASSANGRDYGDSVLKLSFVNDALTVRDFFTPSNEFRLNWSDDDLGSTGPVLLPDQPGPHPHLLAAAGKAGVIYLIDRDRMGKFQSGSDRHAIQTITSPGGVYGAPAYWNGHVYYFASDDVLKDFALKDGRLSAQPVHSGTFKFGNPGAIPSISADGAKNGIVWVVLTKAWNANDGTAVLQAYDAADVGRLLYSTANNAKDGLGRAIRLTIPMVANGRVYVATRNGVYVYGLPD
ncbi:MAG TPA: hypothetical protein VGL53_20800 [Bryobacteraceae bacterium]|jgi:hypothetical protein